MIKNARKKPFINTRATNPELNSKKEPRQKLQHFKLLKANSLDIIPRKLRYSRKYRMTGRILER
jgi:hypothetical protein